MSITPKLQGLQASIWYLVKARTCGMSVLVSIILWMILNHPYSQQKHFVFYFRFTEFLKRRYCTVYLLPYLFPRMLQTNNENYTTFTQALPFFKKKNYVVTAGLWCSRIIFRGCSISFSASFLQNVLFPFTFWALIISFLSTLTAWEVFCSGLV